MSSMILTRDQAKNILTEVLMYDAMTKPLSNEVAARHGTRPVIVRRIATMAGLPVDLSKTPRSPSPKLTNLIPIVSDALVDEVATYHSQEVSDQRYRESRLEDQRRNRPTFWASLVGYLPILFMLGLALLIVINYGGAPSRTAEERLQQKMREGQAAVCDKWGC
jgi:hypothetical protein